MSELIKKHDYTIDLLNNSIKNAKLNPLTTVQRLALVLSISDESYISYDTTLDELFIWTGSIWRSLGGTSVSRYISSTDTLLNTDDVIICTSNTFTINIPEYSTLPLDKSFTIKNIGIGVITIIPYLTTQIEGYDYFSLSEFDYITLKRINNGIIIVGGIFDASINLPGNLPMRFPINASIIQYALVNTYADMIALGVPTKLTEVKVLNDENVGLPNTVYQLWVDGVRVLNSIDLLKPKEITITGNNSFIIPAKKTLQQIIIESTTTQTISIGTTPGGTDLINAAIITSAGSADNPFIVNKWLASTTTIYITGVTTSTYLKFYIQ